MNSDVARFTTHIKTVLQQIRLTGLNVGGKTRNIAFELVLQQCCKTSSFLAAKTSPATRNEGKQLFSQANLLFAILKLNPGNILHLS